MAQQLSIQIKSITRHPVQMPDGNSYDWIGSGPIVDKEDWHATVVIGRDELRRAKDQLMLGKAYTTSLMPDDIIEFRIE